MPNRDNLTVQSISVNSTTPTAVMLPTRYNVFNISAPSVMADVSPYTWLVSLPADGDTAVGDVAEFYVTNRPFDSSTAGILTITDSNGDSFYPSGQDLSTAYPKWSVCIRKVASNTWRMI